MSAGRQILLLHSLVARHATLAMDLEIARAAGYDGLEASASKMRAFLDAGFTEADLSARLRGVSIPGMGFLIDIERHGSDEPALMRDAEAMFALAQVAGARAVQVITGPVDVEAVFDHAAGRTATRYSGVLKLPKAEQFAITAANLRKLADLAAGYGLLLYLESLAWTPLNTLDDQVRLIEMAGRDNLRLVVDFWHCYASGDTPDRVARLPRDILYGVHVCDSLPFSGGIPREAELRDVPTGGGVLDLKAWADAVRSTGYVGWWSAELFCRKQHQEDSFALAAEIRRLLDRLANG
ncbi:sugar phosphate isomerase/epimerase family protein [Pseudoxanthobacter sp.]|uniref:sugar phosphate isomerase/epimerase family protein n=1 Tax=Pseudoxanthobacter sp. TaxID=1925742 RepID=UPI002FE04155